VSGVDSLPSGAAAEVRGSPSIARSPAGRTRHHGRTGAHPGARRTAARCRRAGDLLSRRDNRQVPATVLRLIYW
jgi:hypothetical protein